ncbi:hypothetical protein ACSSS7_005773 [Eimeria intestinalis]
MEASTGAGSSEISSPMQAEGGNSLGASGRPGCDSLTPEGCMPLADQSPRGEGAVKSERPWLPHAFSEKESGIIVHPPRLCGSLEALELASDRCNSESSTCAAERHSSPPPSPDSEGFSLLLSFAQADLGDGRPGEEAVDASRHQRIQGSPQGTPSQVPSSSSAAPCLALKVAKPGSVKARWAGGSSSANRGFLEVFYSRQREQKINEFKTRCETQQSLTAWRRAASSLNSSRADPSSSSSSSGSGSGSALSRFLRSSCAGKQQQGGAALSRTSSSGSWVPWFDKQAPLQLHEEESALQQQRTLLRQLQLRAKEERPRGALVAARSQMLQREQQQDAHARRPSGVALGLEGGSPRLLLTHQRRQQLLQVEQGREGRRRRVRSLPSRLSVWGAPPSAAAFLPPPAAVSSKDLDADRPPDLWWKVKGPAARELGGVAAEAAAKAAAVSAAATAAAAHFKHSVAFFKSLRRTASDTHLVVRARGPCWAGQRQQTRAGVEELLDQALEVGAATTAAATPEEAASVASCVEGLVGALQLRVLQGQQRVKLHFLIQQAAKHHSFAKSSLLLPGGEQELRRSFTAADQGSHAAAPAGGRLKSGSVSAALI